MQSKPSNIPSIYIDDLTFQTHDTKLPTVNELHNHTDNTPHCIDTTTIIDTPPNPNAPKIYQCILNSSDKLFFILYTPLNTLARRWYLVQANIESTMHLNGNYHNDNFYFCVFLANHPSDVRKSDKFSWWWTDWYEYTTLPDTGYIIYGNRVLFTPSRLPNWYKNTQRATETTLGDLEIISGHLNFEEVSTTNPTRTKVKFEDWKHCRDTCFWINILPPKIGSQTASTP